MVLQGCRRMEWRTAMKKIILALAALAAIPVHAQESLVDRVFEVKDKSGTPLLRISNVKTKPIFEATLRNVSGAKLDMTRASTLYMIYTTRGESEKAWIILCQTGARCEIPENQVQGIEAATFLPVVLDSVDFGLSDSWQAEAEAKAKAKIRADEAAARAAADNIKVAAARHEAWEKEVGIEEKKQAAADAAAAKRKATADAAAAKRKATADAAAAKRKATADAAAAERKATTDAAKAAEWAKLKAACAAIYRATVDMKVSDLTVRETEQVQACQVLGLYSK
jgi:hypothetical protein